MMTELWDEIWWKQITGAQLIVSQVTDALLEHKTPMLQVPSDLPWRSAMRNEVASTFRMKNVFQDVMFEQIDVNDQCGGMTKPAEIADFLLRNFGTPEVQKNYRGGAVTRYLTEQNVLANRIIWIKGMNDSSVEQWVNFCKDYKPGSPDVGMFVLEYHDNDVRHPGNGFREIRFSSLVSSYDLQLFNYRIMERNEDCQGIWKNYISTVAAELCEYDAEISEHMITEYDLRKQEPLQILKEIAEDGFFSRRGAEPDSEHILSLVRHNEMKKIQKRLWKAQLQVLFPLIEMERVALVERYEEEIREILSKNCIEQYRKRISQPMDVELGLLVSMIDGLQNGVFLYIPNKSDTIRIRHLHSCRNKLAHAKCCSIEDVQTLFDV